MQSASSPFNYRRWLHEQLAQRKQKNQSLSLRAFASKLSLSPATLSGVLSGKRSLTRKTAAQIAKALNLSPPDKRQLMKAATRAKVTAQADTDFQVIEVENFQLISNWYHYAILSLSELPESRADAEWISQRLGIQKREAEDAYARLLRLKIIEEKEGKFRQVAPPISTRDTLADPAIRSHVLQYLKKAEEAIDRWPPEESACYTIVMAADPKRIDEARKEMKRFRRNICEVMEKGRKRRVYALSLQLFPVDVGHG